MSNLLNSNNIGGGQSLLQRRRMLMMKGNDSPLPAGYTAITGVRSTGVDGIVFTNFYPGGDCNYYIDALTSGNVVSGDFYGSLSYGTSSHMSSVNWNCEYWANSIQIGEKTQGWDEEVHIIIDFQNLILNAEVNGVPFTHTFASAATSEEPKYGVFWHPSSNYVVATVYRLKVSKGDEVYIDLYPCIENSTSRVGFWDKASESFKTCNGLIAIQ